MGDPTAERADDGEYGGGMSQNNISGTKGGGPAGLPKKSVEKFTLKPFNINNRSKGPRTISVPLPLELQFPGYQSKAQLDDVEDSIGNS